MAIKLFGFQLGKDTEKETYNSVNEPTAKSFIPPSNDDGAVTITSGSYYGTYVDLDGSVRNEIELITRYREMSIQPELETAIDEIVNEAIVMDDSGHSIEINMDDLKVSNSVKKKINEEFDHILKLLNFGNMGHEIFRRWYIDGRLFYHVVIDEANLAQGIKEIRYIDPRRIRKIREIQKMKDPRTGIEIVRKQNEYYLYNERGVIGTHSNLGAKIAKDSVVNVNSGLMDSKRLMVLSYLHKAIKPLNQTRMMEDATVIYRLSRAPERRIFYIDVGNMPHMKAEQYLKDVMTKYRNKLVYDSTTGEIRDDRKHLCLSMDTKVPLLDGRTLTLSEISEEYNSGKTLWAYSCDPVTGKFAPGKITWAGISQKNAQVMKLTFDNGKSVICTPQHKFPTWNNGLVEAQNLVVGESMIPFYTKQESINKNKNAPKYLQLYENSTKKWRFVHRLVSEWKDSVNIENDIFETPKPLEKSTKKYKTEHLEYQDSLQYRNHKLMKIEYLDEQMDVGCLTIDGNEEFHNYHTFALDIGIYTKNSMLEDFWFARREGGKGTEIDTLSGAQNLGEMKDVEYFEKKLYKALGVPASRLEQNQGFSLGRTTEITRDELKFNKFILRLRNKFSTLFDDLLRVQLIMKKICTDEEWKEFKEDIWYDYKKDNNFTELKEAELINNRLATLQLVVPYVGIYYSKEWVQKHILHQTDEEMEEIAQQIQAEAANNPAPMIDPATGQPIPPGVPGGVPQGTPLPGQQSSDPNQEQQIPMVQGPTDPQGQEIPPKFEVQSNEMEMVK